MPDRPDTANPDHDMMAQAFYQDVLYYHEFFTDYMAYLEEQVNEETNNNKSLSKHDMSFYKGIAKQLYLSNYSINGTNFFNMEEFIEEKHKQSEFKGDVFYKNLIHAMPVDGDRIADPAKGEAPQWREKIFWRVLDYCNSKIQAINAKKSETDHPGVPREKIPFIGHLITNNRNISKVVLNAYYGMVPQPRSRDDISQSYVGPLNWYNAPFRVCVHEAYPLMMDWELLEYRIESGDFLGRGISDEEMWQVHLKRYSDGFVIGYYSFEEEYLAKKTTLFSTPEDKQRFIFDYVFGAIFLSSGFPQSYGEGISLLSGYFQAGKEAGWFYRAWYLMIENSHRFESMFQREEKQLSEFIPRLVRAIETLQRKAEQQKFIRELKAERVKDESEFRNYIHNNMDSGEFYFIEAEGAQGLKRTDLRVRDNEGRTHIIEFKGWWNTKDRKWVSSQVADYLTDFENSGYVFMVNDQKRDILSDYKKNVEDPENGYIPGSWQEKKVGHSDYEYYVSHHQRGNKVKTIYHFLFRVYP